MGSHTKTRRVSELVYILLEYIIGIFSKEYPFLIQHSPAPKRRLVAMSSGDSPAYAASSPEAASPDSQYSLGNGGGGSKYSSRSGSGQAVLQFNSFIKERGEFPASTIKPLGTRVRLSVDIPEDFDNALQRYRYMFSSLGERAAAIDKHLMSVQTDMMRWKAIAELQPVRVPSQDVVWACGRVCCDAAEGKLNKSSVMIEGSRAESSGRTTQLNLKEVNSFALFPGQIILVQGINAGGDEMVVKSIVEGVPKPLPMTAPSRLLDYHHTPMYQGGKPVSMFCAAGPYTPADDLGYRPLKDLLGKVLAEKPDVLVLLGPFVDIKQPLLASGETWLVDDDTSKKSLASYELIFMQSIVRDCLQAYFNAEEVNNILPTQIILVPSLSDGHHDFVYPQPPFGNRGAVKSALFEEELGNLRFPFEDKNDNKKRVNLMPNPCMFK